MEFEWDEVKRQRNLDKHGLDFRRAPEVFTESTSYEFPSDRQGEFRWVRVGKVDGVAVAVVFTRRGSHVRIISFRRARRNESEKL